MSVGEHAMQDDCELARERHLGFAHPGALGQPHGPALELRAAPDRLRQHDMGRLIERFAHGGIADLADAPGAVGLAGLMLLL